MTSEQKTGSSNTAKSFVKSAGPQSTELTLYMGGHAVIRECRHVDLGEGATPILLENVPEHYQPGSLNILSVKGPGDFNAGATTYRTANLDTLRIMAGSCGKKVSVPVMGNNGKVTKQSGTLTAVCGRDQVAVTLANKRVVLVPIASVELEEGLPDGLSATSSLVMAPRVSKPGHYEMTLLYQSDGLSWSPRYSAFYDPKKNVLTRLDCSVLVINQSGGKFDNAILKLLAGSNHEQSQYRSKRGYGAEAAGARMMLASAAPQFDSVNEETVGESHMYPLPNPVTLAPNDMQQCYLLRAVDVPVDEEFVLQEGGHESVTSDDELNKLPVNIRLKVRNSGSDSKISCSLPAGPVGIYQADSSGSEQKIGNCNIAHISQGEQFNLEYGPAADVKATRRLLSTKDFEEVDEEDAEDHHEPAILSDNDAQAEEAELEDEAADEESDAEEAADSEPNKKAPLYRQEKRQLVVYNYKPLAVVVAVSESVPEKAEYVTPPNIDYYEKDNKSVGGNDKFNFKTQADLATSRVSVPPHGKSVVTYTIRYRIR